MMCTNYNNSELKEECDDDDNEIDDGLLAPLDSSDER